MGTIKDMRAAALLILSFAASVRAQTGYLTYGAGINPSGIAAADLNGDGKPDLAVANLGSDSLSIFLNSGTNGFLSGAPSSFASLVRAAVCYDGGFEWRS